MMGAGAALPQLFSNPSNPNTPTSPPTPHTQSLLCDPNPNSPANSEAARLYNENRREYNRRVQEVVEVSWQQSTEVE